MDVFFVAFEIAPPNQLVSFSCCRKAIHETRRQGLNGETGGAEKVRDEVVGIFVSHGEANRGWANAAFGQRLGIEFRMSCQGGAAYDRIRLAKANHVSRHR